MFRHVKTLLTIQSFQSSMSEFCQYLIHFKALLTSQACQSFANTSNISKICAILLILHKNATFTEIDMQRLYLGDKKHSSPLILRSEVVLLCRVFCTQAPSQWYCCILVRHLTVINPLEFSNVVFRRSFHVCLISPESC